MAALRVANLPRYLHLCCEPWLYGCVVAGSARAQANRRGGYHAGSGYVDGPKDYEDQNLKLLADLTSRELNCLPGKVSRCQSLRFPHSFVLSLQSWLSTGRCLALRARLQTA